MNVFNNLPESLHVLDGKKYNRWQRQMKVLFCFQDVLEIVVDSSVEGLAANATEVQRVAHKALKKNIFGHIKH